MIDLARRKAAQNIPIVPWLSAKPNCKDGRFIQIGNSLLLSKAFQQLTAGAQLAYLCMSMESGGKMDFQFPKSALRKYGLSETSGARYIKELIAAGFIEIAESGRTTRTPNRYCFSFQWKDEK